MPNHFLMMRFLSVDASAGADIFLLMFSVHPRRRRGNPPATKREKRSTGASCAVAERHPAELKRHFGGDFLHLSDATRPGMGWGAWVVKGSKSPSGKARERDRNILGCFKMGYQGKLEKNARVFRVCKIGSAKETGPPGDAPGGTRA
jgi:hypothetical protein